MSDAASIARKAKSLNQGLKELLKSREPWDKEVEFQRKDLRKKYLCLLLVHPSAKESKDAETQMWMQTSYAFISMYKQRIGVLDRAIQSASRQNQQNQQQQGGHRQPGGQGPIVEHRKLVSRLRQFLAEEEKFWGQLVVRMRRSYGLEEAQGALTALEIASAVEDTGEPPDGAQAVPQGRNQFQFPAEDHTRSVTPTTPAERASRLVVISKALVCLGDLARYRESYKDGGGRDARRGGRRGRGGMPDAPRARNYSRAQLCYEKARLLAPYDGNASHQLAILASYEKDVFSSLIHYYRALCLEQPYETAAENFGTVLNKALEQWRLRVRRDRERGHMREHSASTAAAVRADAFKDKVVVLHALWRLNVHKMDTLAPGQARMIAEEFRTLVSDRILSPEVISRLIVLSEGALWKHRMIRDSSSSSNKSDAPNASGAPSTSAGRAAIGARMFKHLLALHQVLLEVGLIELAEPPPLDAEEGDLAQHITAVFRRTLPALRIAGKWLRANFSFVMTQYTQNSSADMPTAVDRADNSELDTSKDDTASNVGTAVYHFFEIYARFNSALLRAFPPEKLPAVKLLLEEDVEMRGFLPLGRLMGEAPSSVSPESGNGLEEAQKPSEEQVHPNVEQLMRIADLLNDAKLIANLEGSPLTLTGNRFVVRSVPEMGASAALAASGLLVESGPPPVERSKNAPPPLSQQKLMDEIRNESLAFREGGKIEDDSLTENTFRTDDDPVGDAFRQVLGDEDQDKDIDEDEEDEIVWNPRPTLSPIVPMAQTAVQSPVTPHKAISPVKTALSLTRPKNSSATPLVASKPLAGTTAQDLLNSIGLSVRSPPNSSVTSTSASTNDLYRSALPQISTANASQSQLLFGGSMPQNRPGHSIWSATFDDKLPSSTISPHSGQHPFGAPAHAGPPPIPGHSHSQSFSPSGLTQSIWGSPQSTLLSQNTQLSQLGIPPTLSPTLFPHAAPLGVPSHQRVPSASLAAQGGQLYSTPIGTSNVLALQQQQASLLANSMQHYSSPTMSASAAASYMYTPNLQPSADDMYGPIGGALYETPQPPVGHMRGGSSTQLAGYHTRHMSLASDPRLQQTFGASRPLQPTWGSTG